MDLSDEQLARLRKKLASAKSYEDLMGKDGAIKDLLNDNLFRFRKRFVSYDTKFGRPVKRLTQHLAT